MILQCTVSCIGRSALNALSARASHVNAAHIRCFNALFWQKVEWKNPFQLWPLITQAFWTLTKPLTTKWCNRKVLV